jgi:KDO2-lipid IV(A) lauroyltransferase
MPDQDAPTQASRQRHRFPRKRSGPFKNTVEWLLVSACVRTLEALPARVSRGLLLGLAALGGVLSPSRTRRARENVRLALGVDEKRAAEIVRGAYRILFLNAVEPVHLQRVLDRQPLDEVFDVEGLEHVQPLVESGQGILMAVAHFGAWECTAIALSRLLKPAWSVTRHLENERLSEWLVARRGPVIAGALDKDGDVRKLIRLLKQGEIVGPLLDQNAGFHGFLMDFLGQPCWQHRLPGKVATRFGIPVVPLYGLHQPGSSRLKIIFEAPILADPELSGLEAELDVTRRLNASLERRVREAPHEWLWLHDRWRRARKALADGTAKAGEPLADMERASVIRRETLRKKTALLGSQ